MSFLLLKLLVLYSFLAIIKADAEIVNGTESEENEKSGKILSLFSIVQFKNVGCRSQSALSSGQSSFRNGTCYTSTECANKGGTGSGNCAAGFGVCCVFIVTGTGTVSQNCTYVRNPGFPSAYTATSGLTYTVSKCTNEICYLRLDFETFTTLGPSDTLETLGGVCPDTLKITSSSGQLIPTICGQNAGQHIYVDVGNQAGDTATLTFGFSGVTTIRTWEIKVSQIECYNENRPPPGCLQYWTTLTGRITTFNFLSTTSSNLQNQLYTNCIRRENGYCCIEYQVCSGVPFAFSLDAPQAATIGLVGTSCTKDYIDIPGGSTTCTVNSNTVLGKWCGNALNPLGTIGTDNVPICDCTSPFIVSIHTDNTADAAFSRGNCLDYKQIPCSSGF